MKTNQRRNKIPQKHLNFNKKRVLCETKYFIFAENTRKTTRRKITMKKKFVNFRPIFLIAITLLVATFFATKVCVVQGLKLAFFIALLVFASVCFVVFAFKKLKILMVVGCTLLFASYPFLNVFIKGERLENYKQFNTEVVSVTGTASGSYKIKNGKMSFDLKNAEVLYCGKEIKISGMLTVYCSPDNLVLDQDFRSGTLLNFTAQFNMLSCQEDNLKRAYSFLSSNMVGIAYANEGSIKNLGYHPTLGDRVHNYIATKLQNANLKNSGIAMALLIGDTAGIDRETTEEFRLTGIAHLLAVSGLHVSVLMVLLNFILKKCKVKAQVSLIITGIILAIYCYICNFSVSIIRASIMALVCGYATARGNPYDKLSSLSLASVLTMLWSPLIMFNLSYQLSFLAVLSMCCLSPVLERLFSKKLKKGLTDALAVDVAIDIGLVAIMCHYFGRVSLITVPANLILIPISSLAFMVLIVGFLISAVLPFMSFLMLGYDYLMNIVVQFNSWLANLNWSVSVSTSSLVVILTMLLVWICSDYLFASRKAKGISASVLSIGICVLLLI